MHRSITTQDFDVVFRQLKPAILDLREDAALLPNALQIPATELPSRLGELDKDTTYFVLSYSGRKAAVITEFLAEQGYDAVLVIGGAYSWQRYAA
ncbi:rhodanese-like domain-containing protein [Enterococcus canis]|nr:rhodanese-like domain-containing protein [Enterococcus canis]